MTKKERVWAVLKGQTPDRIPTGFWKHFPQADFYGRAAVQAHLDFFERTQTDICKVMTEYLYPCDYNIFAASDWSKLPSYGADAAFIQDQADIVREVARACPDAPVLATIHGIGASASHALLGQQRYDMIGRYAELFHARTDPEAVAKAFHNIADTMSIMAREMIRAGADGIYYAALGGASDGFTDAEHRELIAPLDRQVLNAAYDAGAKLVVLHMCKPRVNLQRFVDYPCDIVNWGIEESGVSMAQGRTIFKDKVLLGGFDYHHGPVVTGDYETLCRDMAALVQEAGKEKLIFGSDCTLPSDIPDAYIANVARASEQLEATT